MAADGGLQGILVVDKPVGPTSHDIVALVRRLTSVRRIGHGGTLDPFARGVLPLFVGAATRMVEYHARDPKTYRATVVFGARSSTDDLEGELTPGAGPPPERAAVEAALAAFRGTVTQRPPAYSAVKVAGRRAYRAARAGEPITVPERTVTISRLELNEWEETDPLRPAATLEVECSAGTYIRALARDLGEALGCGAHLAALVRTASGPFTLDGAVEPDRIRQSANAGTVQRLLLPMDHGLGELPRITVADEVVRAVAKGQVVRPGGAVAAVKEGRVRVVDGAARLVAIARLEGGRLFPEKVFVERGT
jgi:tRNA pseudouridine55 synthase